MPALKSMWRVVLMLSFSAFCSGSVCKYPGTTIHNSSAMTKHVLHDPVFWQHFQYEVQSRSWKCNFPTNALLKDLEKDATLYNNDTIFRKRRQEAVKWVKNDSLWITLILGACKEIADGKVGVHSSQLQRFRVLMALDDYVEHLNCFYTVAMEMASRGKTIKPLSQDSSQIHDIDKLDPIMMVGYSERFEDNQVTSLWDICVDRHVHVNPHHQGHSLWQEDCCVQDSCVHSQDIRDKALSEMVCDKVSRRLQKNLDGVVSEDMWNVDMVFFQGLPENWLNKAMEILKDMKY